MMATRCSRNLIGASCILICSVALLAVGISPAAAQSAPPDLRSKLNDAAGGQARLADHSGTGLVRFFGTTKEHAVARPRGLAANASPEAAARSFLGTYGSLFGAGDQAQQLQPTRTIASDQGRSAVRFQQVHSGVPVFGGQLVVNLDADKNILSANGELLSGLTVGTTPAISASDARAVAVAAIAKQRGLDPAGLRAGTASLQIHNPVLLGDGGRPLDSLVWLTEVTNPGGEPIRERVLVNAKTRAIVLHFDQIAEAKDRTICDRNNIIDPNEACTPITRTEGGAPTGIADVDLAYDYSGNTYDYYFSNFARDSIDGAGLPLQSVTRFCPDSPNCPFANAFWNGDNMVYGEGYASADDVVGHELTHGVTQYESDLLYYYQSGALNESLSDVFGELVDLTNGLGTDTPAVRWSIGEDLPIGAIRSMQNPPSFGDPDSMASPNYFTGSADNGGVHSNSGVNNKNLYLMVDGGTFNGVTVSPLGTTKAGHIYYEAQTNLLTSGSDYQDLFEILQQACYNKVGTAGITAANCGEVKKAVTATRMNQPGPGGGALEAPICESGDNPTDLFFDDMENSGSGNWAFGGVGSDPWGYTTGYATSGTLSLHVPDVWAPNDQTATRSSAVVPPIDKATYLLFNHAYDAEANWDGGKVEYSTNGGGTWDDAGSLFVNNGYNMTNTDGPFAGQSVFSSVSMGYGSSRIDLTSLAGSSVLFRFRFGSDDIVGALGWLVDDVRVYTCGQPAPSITVNDISVAEGNAGTTPATFTITRSGNLSGSSSVDYATSSGTATPNVDFGGLWLTANFAAGESSKAVTVDVNGDTANEPNETFSVVLLLPEGGIVSDDVGVATIVNDDPAPGMAINDVAVAEGDAGTTVAAFTITRSGDLSGASSVNYATAGIQATAGSDFINVGTTTVAFLAGESAKPVNITVNGDTVSEAHENFLVALATPVNAVIVDSQGIGTITDDDAGVPARISVSDVTISEGNAGTLNATFTVSRAGSTAEAVSVTAVTAAGTAAAGTDYTTTGPTVLNLGIGVTSANFVVPVVGDVVDEANETFLVNLAAPVKATIIDNQGVGTIVDNDGVANPAGPATFLAVNDVTASEGGSGFTNFTFTVTRSGNVSGASSLAYKTFQGTARLGTDLVFVNDTTINFAATETTKAAVVQVYGDPNAETNETFVVSLRNPVGATMSDSIGIGIITNDDSGVPGTLAVNDVTVGESNSGTAIATFNVTRSGNTAEPVTVNFATADGTGAAPGDYVAIGSTSLIFAETETTKTVTVAVKGDGVVENDETLLVNLSLPVGAAIADAQGVGSIKNDDPLPSVSANDVYVTEGNGGRKTVTVTVTRTGDLSGASSVSYTTSAITATYGVDYLTSSATLNFAAGESAKTITVTIVGDSRSEPNETTAIALSSPVASTISDNGLITIVNDD